MAQKHPQMQKKGFTVIRGFGALSIRFIISLAYWKYILPKDKIKIETPSAYEWFRVVLF